jgi:hypothetical protein
MKKEILYTTAFNENGILIRANDAEKIGKYFCPICKNELMLRKSGKIGKGTKRPHFAHRFLTENCTPESVLHYSFKKMLLEEIHNHIKKQLPMNMIWDCNYCYHKHEGNLLKKVFGAKDEYDIKTCRPDIALFDETGKVFAVIEIVVTHKPEDNAIKYYKENNIILIQIVLDSENDLENIDNKLKNPSIVDCCFNPKCRICGSYKTKKELVIVNTSCYRCGRPIKICYVLLNRNFIGPGVLDKNEIDFAKSKGVLLEMRFSKTTNEKYLANVCPNCKAFIGDFFIHEYVGGNDPKYNIGYFCENCEYEK